MSPKVQTHAAATGTGLVLGGVTTFLTQKLGMDAGTAGIIGTAIAVCVTTVATTAVHWFAGKLGMAA